MAEISTASKKCSGLPPVSARAPPAIPTIRVAMICPEPGVWKLKL